MYNIPLWPMGTRNKAWPRVILNSTGQPELVRTRAIFSWLANSGQLAPWLTRAISPYQQWRRAPFYLSLAIPPVCIRRHHAVSKHAGCMAKFACARTDFAQAGWPKCTMAIGFNHSSSICLCTDCCCMYIVHEQF